MADSWGDQLSSVNFICRECGYKFQAAPSRVDEDPEREHHPFRYFCDCPECGAEAPQAAWERALLKAHVRATGPRTEAGKKASAANLEGHPTAAETQITRFNALKHGVYAETAQYFPARPGKYAACEGCEYRDSVCVDQAAKGGPCVKRAEIFMVHQLAFDKRDPKLLTVLNTRLQSSVRAIMDDILRTIIRDGVSLRSPEWYYDKDGGFHLAEYVDDSGEMQTIMQVEEHPLLKVLIALLQKNNMTLADMGMTAREQDEDALVRGHLDEKRTQQSDALEYNRRTAEALEGLTAMIERSRRERMRDPVLIEYGQGALEGPDGG